MRVKNLSFVYVKIQLVKGSDLGGACGTDMVLSSGSVGCFASRI